MMIWCQSVMDGRWKPARWKSFRAIKCWATRNKCVYIMRGGALTVSTPDGFIHRYSENPAMCEPGVLI